jgi:dTDP-4-amino-4,6-dideoxygalactose transaminase
MHATKTFGVGEGGAILCRDPGLARAAVAALNFGFDGVRETTGPGLNGRMSEYHAAVGLAELDGWAVKRAALRRVADRYRNGALAVGLDLHTAPEVSSCYVIFEAADGSVAKAAQDLLRRGGIDYRFWYGQGLHRERYFQTHARDPLPGVESVAPRLIGLPVAPDLPDEIVDRIVAALARSLG